MVGTVSIELLNLAHPRNYVRRRLVVGGSFFGFGFLRIRRPRRHDTHNAGVSDRLTQMLSAMADDEQQNTSLGILSSEPIHAFVEIGVGHGLDRSLCVGERVFKGGDDLGFIACGFLQSLKIDA